MKRFILVIRFRLAGFEVNLKVKRV